MQFLATFWCAMFPNIFFFRNSGLLRRFFVNSSGTIAVFAAVLLALVIVPLIGATIDYARVSSTKIDLQYKLDATALNIAKSIDQKAMNGGSSSKFAKERARLETEAANFFQVMYPNYKYLDKYEDFSLSLEDEYIELNVTGYVNLNFGAFFGTEVSQIGTVSRVGFAKSSKVKGDFYFALDHSTSMRGAPEANLRKAARRFVNKLYEKEVDSTISMVPFYQYRSSNHGFYIYEKKVLDEKDAILSFINSMRAVSAASGPGSDVYSCSNDVLLGLLNQANKKSESSTFVLMSDFDNYCPVYRIISACKTVRDAGHKLIAIQFGRNLRQKSKFVQCAGDESNYYYATTADDIFAAFNNEGKTEGIHLSK